MWAEYRRLWRAELRLEALTAYGGDPPRCANPYGLHQELFTVLDALQFDHVDGGGNRDRRAKGVGQGGWPFYLKLKKLGRPKGYQVLCANCNQVKKVRNKEYIGGV